ncbi:DUF6457 domain-containing protein [Microbacterium aurantiacum]|uniref:DUF6457 domain-containing protein n=1 Tax=Microbacterium aurantiacum TaxID=162393 RepID=UPI000C80B58A|nr:DUF6457 domain-containing protein [Microbacterium aurantiacum]
MPDSPAVLEEWVTALAEALGIEDTDVPTDLLLGLTREVAHGVVRPAGPLATYLVGIAVTAGMPVEDAVARTRAAIAGWQAQV